MIAALSGPYDNCSCPAGYTLDVSGTSPACAPVDPSWSPEAPTCTSVPAAPPSSPNPADEGVSGQAMLVMGLAAIALVALAYEM